MSGRQKPRPRMAWTSPPGDGWPLPCAGLWQKLLRLVRGGEAHRQEGSSGAVGWLGCQTQEPGPGFPAE